MKAESESGDPRRGLQRPRFDGGLARVPDPPQPGRWARCCRERRGSSQAALTSEHYGSPPTRGPSEKTLLQTPTPGSPSPSSLGGRFPRRPWWSQAGPGQECPLWALSATPPKSWVQCLLSHSNASNGGPSRRPQRGPVGPWEGSRVYSPLSPPSGASGGPPQAGGVPSLPTTGV